ncbi:MAG: amidohydrolase family protein, partial [Candidatus Bathyarchaeia archaeon]
MSRGTLAIFADMIIDGTGNKPLRDPVVLVEGKYIRSVGQRGDVKIPEDSKVLYGDGLTILPGLVDAHIHLTGNRPRDVAGQFDKVLGIARAVADARTLLEHGVTAARCCGSFFTPSIKTAVEEGAILGPRFMAARAAISQTYGHADVHHLPLSFVRRYGSRIGVLADGVDACVRAVREQLRGRADLIKLMLSGGTGTQLDELEYPQFSTEEIHAMVREAHLNGRRVAAHAHGLAGIRNAVQEGIDSIEHGSAINEECAVKVAAEGKFIVPTR